MKTEIPAGMRLNQKTKAILNQVENKGSVFFEADDSQEWYIILSQLVEISGNVGYTLFNVRGIMSYICNDIGKIHAGPYILFDAPAIHLNSN